MLLTFLAVVKVEIIGTDHNEIQPNITNKEAEALKLLIQFQYYFTNCIPLL